MFEIRIIDPKSSDSVLLKCIAKMLCDIADDQTHPQPCEKLAPIPTGSPIDSTKKDNFIIPTGSPLEATPFNPFSAKDRIGKPETIPPIPSAPPRPFTPPSGLTPDELDARGIRYDARIHAKSRTKNANGTWRYARSIDADFIQQIESELLNSVPEIKIEDTLPTLPPTMDVVAIGPLNDPLLPKLDFPALMQKITENVSSGKLNAASITKISTEFGLASIALAGTRLDLIPMLLQRIDEVIALGGTL